MNSSLPCRGGDGNPWLTTMIDGTAAAAAFDAILAARSPWLAVRPEVTADSPFLRALFLAANPLAGLLPPVLLEQQADIRLASFRDNYPQAMRRIFEVDASPIGRFIVDWTAPEGSLGVDLAVRAEYRRRGVASAALEAWKAVADTHGLACALTVLPDNPARQLYARLGFVEAPHRESDAGVRMFRPASHEPGGSP
jgi:GNAT superfamily N-acetyltransferase